jgi:DNA-binding transcriptional MerR regulator
MFSAARGAPPMLAQVDAAEVAAGAIPDGAARARPDGAAGEPEYRIGELAREAGVTPRTVRYYQERKLLPPPRRVGRIAWYSRAHLVRLRVIGQLLERGHTLAGTGELISAWEQGYDLSELLGLERAMTTPWSEETPVSVTASAIPATIAEQLTPEVLAEAVALGYVKVEGDRVTHVSSRLLDITSILVREGIPLSAILAASRELQASLDKTASLFVELVATHVLDRGGGLPRSRDVARLAEVIERLRPVARIVIDAEFARAMDRRARVTFDELIRLLAAKDHHGQRQG